MKQCLTNVEKISKLHRNVACHSSQPLHTVIYHAEVTEVRRKCSIYIYIHIVDIYSINDTYIIVYCIAVCIISYWILTWMLSCCLLPLFKEPPIECGKAKTATFSPCQEHPRSAEPWQQGFEDTLSYNLIGFWHVGWRHAHIVIICIKN